MVCRLACFDSLFFRKKYLFVSKERATQLIALSHTDNQAEAENLIREIQNPLEFQHEFYCRLYPQIVDEISNLEDNWRKGGCSSIISFTYP